MNDIGLLGLGVMGQSLALNIANKGYNVSVFNITSDLTRTFMETRAKDRNIFPFYDIKSFVESLSKPRKIFLMIVAGQPVDEMIQKLIPYLDKGDLIIDGGNSYYKDTTRRLKELKEKGILYLGVGVSGGESGALNGPSLMPGGTIEAYDLVKDILLKISAQTESGPCCAYVGNDSAGHFVKMLHNGIEYGMMQAISEVYDILRKVLKLSTNEIAEIFEEWNRGELNSFLIEISHKLMRHIDKSTGKPTLELILDKAGQKGTGKWTAEAALELGIPTPSLNAAVEGRIITFFKEDRTKLSRKIQKKYPDLTLDKEKIIEELKNALLFSNFILFSQGLWLMSEASKVYGYNIRISDVLKIWKGGCIIRAKMLDFYREIVDEKDDNSNLLNNEKSIKFLMEKIESVKYITNVAREYYIPMLIHNTALDYFLSMTEENLPANLIQAQRDFFGAHTYSRIDMEGTFHTIWE
ncbi:NADP-dependent phosphogluconate dehydrogenase [Fonticella tunisiensis]|uniref:6-phosphogluconate dehydrogenase, decarboxylating n=1 Tax=Fonticella tunisiensis TaxID=1096341 RepID=A0A4R7KBA0_9CLOT|nr:NADP-dependent phosphogluconate dehydrogenase [Fonticella tunisiensis]TDT51300.1 6-phosphogluconate dehydrogenase (decarboxylating) [Fonticella tunisiensis]